MSLYNYFTKLGTVNYNGDIVSNIISSVRFKELTLLEKANFYPYTIKEGERPDNIAYKYYEDERYAWLIFLCNKIIDPYYEWPLSANDFRDFIIKKYGSIEYASQNVKFYRNNYDTDETILSTTAYDALPAALKKYWNPNFSLAGNVVSYVRKQDDHTVETNKVISLTFSNTDGFINDEKVTQSTSGVITATGQIKFISSTKLVLQHITGTFAATGGSVGSIVGLKSKASKSTSAVTTVHTPLSEAEANYWSPVDAYSYEDELNESRKNIVLIDRAYINTIEDQMIELLS